MSYPSHRPSLSLKVFKPLSELTTAPVNTTMCFIIKILFKTKKSDLPLADRFFFISFLSKLQILCCCVMCCMCFWPVQNRQKVWHKIQYHHKACFFRMVRLHLTIVYNRLNYADNEFRIAMADQ